MSAARLPYLDASAIAAALSMEGAIAAIATALRAGLEPEDDPARQVVPVVGRLGGGQGHLLVMPSASAWAVGVKVVSVAPDEPQRRGSRIQGAYLLFDRETLAPRAVLDGAALTALRTPAVSGVAIDRLAVPEARRLVVFGTGPQAWGHVLAACAVRPITEVAVRGRDPGRVAAFVERCREELGLEARVADDDAIGRAEILCCCTTARTPIVSGREVGAQAMVVAIGSHEPDRREVDAALCARAMVVVEARSAALREAGDVVMAIAEGALDPATLVPLARLVRGEVAVPEERPRLFKSVGMAWQDAVVAAAIVQAAT